MSENVRDVLVGILLQSRGMNRKLAEFHDMLEPIVELADDLFAALDAAGFAIVPKFPTEEMLTATERVVVHDEDGEMHPTTFDPSEASAVYAAMLKAVPKP